MRVKKRKFKKVLIFKAKVILKKVMILNKNKEKEIFYKLKKILHMISKIYFFIFL